jgi:hypothetical protein
VVTKFSTLVPDIYGSSVSTPFFLAFWRLEFFGGPKIFGKFMCTAVKQAKCEVTDFPDVVPKFKMCVQSI